MGAVEQGVTEGEDLVGQGIEQLGAGLGRGETEGIAGGFGGLESGLDLLVSGVGELAVERGSGGGIAGGEGGACGGGFDAGDEVISCE